jgi:hypothetical protein
MKFKAKLGDPDLILNGQLNVIPSAVVTQAMAAAGMNFVIIDQEHGPIGREAAAKRAALPLGGVAFNQDAADRLIARGYRLLVGFDVVWLKSAFSHSVGWCGRYAAPDQGAPSGTGAR